MALHRILAAALVTLAALALLAAIALGAGGSESQPAAAPKPKIRTVVVHRTIHVRPKHTAPAPALPAATTSSPRGEDDHARGHDFDDDHGGDGHGNDDHSGHGGDDDHSGHGGGND